MLPIDQLTKRSQRIRAELKEPLPMTKVKAQNIPQPKHMTTKGYRSRITTLINTERELESRLLKNMGFKA